MALYDPNKATLVTPNYNATAFPRVPTTPIPKAPMPSASTPPNSTIDASTFTPEQYAALQNATQALGVQGKVTITPPVISASSLSSDTPPVDIPPKEQNSDNGPMTLEEYKTLIESTTTGQKTAQGEQSSILAEAKRLFDQQGTEAARTAELETAAGIPDLNKQLNEINAQIRGINSSAFSETQKSENRLAPTFAIYGEQAQIERQRSAQTYGLAAASQALQGNIALAQQNVERAITKEFGPIESQLKYQQLLLDVNKDKMTREDQKKADTLSFALNERNRQLQEAKEAKKQIYDIMLAAAQNRADNTTLNAIQKAKTPEEALVIAAEKGFVSQAGLPASAQEYLFAKNNGYDGTFSEYQNEDANRKRSIAAAGVANASGMNPKEVAIFNGIVDKYNKSPLVAANDRAVILRDITSAVEKDPTNASLQVSFIYSLIQALDTYQSAVREGEIGLISGTQGLGEQLANLPSKIQQGNPLAASKVAQYISTSKLLTDSINSAAQRTKQKFEKQADLVGVGGAFTDFTSVLSGEPPASDPLQLGGGSPNNPLGI